MQSDEREIIIMEGDNDQFYTKELQNLSQASPTKGKKGKKDFDLRIKRDKMDKTLKNA